MSFLLDDAAFGGQIMCGAGQPIALGIGAGENKKIRGSAFIEGPAQIGKSSDFPERLATLMVGRTGNVDIAEKPEKSVYVMGDVVIDGRQTEGANPGSAGGSESNARTLLVQGTVTIETLLNQETGEPLLALLVKGDTKMEGNLLVEGNIEAGESIAAATSVTSDGGTHLLSAKKNFDIPHPTKEGWRLRHTCPEGPSNDVYVRGRVKNKTEIELPLYWKELVDIQSITINLTPIGAHQDVIIKRWDENKIYLQAKGGMPIDCFYHVYGTRTDGEDLIAEYQGLTPNDYPGDNSEYNINT